MMNAVVAGQKVQGVYVQPGAAESLSYLRVSEARGAEEQRAGAAGAGAAGVAGAPRAAEQPRISIVDAMYDSSVCVPPTSSSPACINGSEGVCLWWRACINGSEGVCLRWRASAHGRSFKEALEQLAETHGLLFLPKPGKSQAGKQVYGFGKVPVYLDGNRLVYAQEGPGGAWKPLALDDLLRRAQAKG
jgi:hypothetical protein